MILYATAAQLETWMDATPEGDVKPLLRRASGLVGRACRNDRYYTQANGLPVDDDLIEALQDATCAQVEVWIAAGVDPIAGDTTQTAQPVWSEIDGARINFDPSGAVAASRAKSAAIDGLCDEAWDILRAAGLGTAAI